MNLMIERDEMELNRKLLRVKRYQINSFQPEKSVGRLQHEHNRFRMGQTFVIHRVSCRNPVRCVPLFEEMFCYIHWKDAELGRKCHNITSISSKMFESIRKSHSGQEYLLLVNADLLL